VYAFFADKVISENPQTLINHFGWNVFLYVTSAWFSFFSMLHYPPFPFTRGTHILRFKL
jgi:hypothetical protein